MWNLLKRRLPKQVVVIPLDQRGPYHAVWINQTDRLPTPGVKGYAYATLGLMPEAVVGAAISVRGPGFDPTQPVPAMQLQSVTPAGIATTAGSIYRDPLFDPNAPGTGFTDPFTGNNNVPYPHFEIAPAGEAI